MPLRLYFRSFFAWKIIETLLFQLMCLVYHSMAVGVINLFKLIEYRCLINLFLGFFQNIIITLNIIDILLTFRYKLYKISILIDLIPHKERTMHNIYAGCHMLLLSRFTAIPCLSLQAVKHISVPKRNSTSSIKNSNSFCTIFYFVKKKQKITKNHTKTRMM